MKRTAFLLALLGAIIQGTPATAAEVENPDNGHYYDIININRTWATARTEADKLRYKGMMGHLVTITTQAESDFIVNKVINGLSGTRWIGAYQPSGSSEPSGGWTWVTGEKWS